jgi:hypothetical protein
MWDELSVDKLYMAKLHYWARDSVDIEEWVAKQKAAGNSIPTRGHRHIRLAKDSSACKVLGRILGMSMENVEKELADMVTQVRDTRAEEGGIMDERTRNCTVSDATFIALPFDPKHQHELDCKCTKAVLVGDVVVKMGGVVCKPVPVSKPYDDESLMMGEVVIHEGNGETEVVFSESLGTPEDQDREAAHQDQAPEDDDIHPLHIPLQYLRPDPEGILDGIGAVMRDDWP